MTDKIDRINPIFNKKEKYVEMDILNDNKYLRFNPITKEYYLLKYAFFKKKDNNVKLNL